MATIIEQARASGNNDMALDAGINFRAPPILPLTMPQAGRIKPLISLQCAADSLLPKNVLTLRNTGGQRTNIQAVKFHWPLVVCIFGSGRWQAVQLDA